MSIEMKENELLEKYNKIQDNESNIIKKEFDNLSGQQKMFQRMFER